MFNTVYKFLGEKDTKNLPASSSNGSLADIFARFLNEQICKKRTNINLKREHLNITDEPNHADGSLDIKLHTFHIITEKSSTKYIP